MVPPAAGRRSARSRREPTTAARARTGSEAEHLANSISLLEPAAFGGGPVVLPRAVQIVVGSDQRLIKLTGEEGCIAVEPVTVFCEPGPDDDGVVKIAEVVLESTEFLDEARRSDLERLGLLQAVSQRLSLLAS